jgi:16S rRNA processing protein RimM
LTEFFLIAKLISLSDIPGYINIYSYSDFPDRFLNIKKVFIDFDGEKKELSVQNVICTSNSFKMKFENFNSEEECGILLNREIFVDESNLISLPPGVFFIHDLIGSKVINNNEILGEIVDVLQLPANDVYVIKDARNKEILIPALKKVIEKFDPVEKKLILKQGEIFFEDEN